MRKSAIVVVAGLLALTACGGGSSTTATGQSGTTGGAADCAATTSPSAVAQNTAFNTSCLAVPAGQTFTLTLDNKDAGTPHSIAILASHESSQIFASTGIFPGVDHKSVTV